MWGIAVAPDKKGFVSVSADKSVKFWDFELVTTADSAVRLPLPSFSLSLSLSVSPVFLYTEMATSSLAYSIQAFDMRDRRSGSGSASRGC